MIFRVPLTTAILSAVTLLGAAGAAIAQPVSPDVELKTTPDRIGPRLEFAPSVVQFGQIEDSKEVFSTVTLTNTGDATLEIPETGGVKGSCGCTVPTLPKFTLEPGESMEVEVKFDPRNRQGKQAKTITIQTNSERGPTVIPVEALVIQRVQFVEGVANFGNVDQGDTPSFTVRVRGSDTEFKVTDVEVSRPDAFVAKVIGHGFTERDDLVSGQMVEVGESTIEITLLPGAPVGRTASDLKIETNDVLVPEHKTQASVNVLGDLRFDRPQLGLGQLAPGETFERTVTLYSNKADAFNIDRIVFVSSTLSPEDRQKIVIEHEPTSDEAGLVGYTITIRGEVTETMRVIQGRMTILTDRPGQRVVTANMSGVVRTAQRR
ncbi:MAG: DUF1573 domain-containing protein [Phycisphaerales bacterium]